MFYLASGSPRRKELLSLIFEKFTVLVPDYDEIIQQGEKPLDFVKRMSCGKAEAFYNQFKSKLNVGDQFMTADTIVAQDDVVFGKPKDRGDAYQILQTLQESAHEVITSVTVGVVNPDLKVSYDTFAVSTKVHFRKMSHEMIENYLDTDEPWDKAGAYGIQGIAGKFVEKIDGNYHNVVGLPVAQLAKRLLG
jgi:septum formation protein